MISGQKIIVIVGPTAVGKTALSIRLAKLFNGEIISADSRQIYRQLDIGTEKITAEEMEGVPHHLISLIDPNEQYTALNFKNDADKLIDEIKQRGHLPIIVGGTFFYINVWIGRASLPNVPPNRTLRKKLATKSAAWLYQQLTKTDPNRASTIDKNNKRRLIRALEISDALGQVPPPEPIEKNHNPLIIGLKIDPDKLRQKIIKRADEALKKGLVAETKSLLADGLSKERLNEIGLEYRLVIEYLDELYDQTTLLKKISEKNWQYAKRQLTWLKKDPEIKWFNPTDLQAITAEVKNFINK